MENTIRVIITIFFIGLIALAIIFFGVFGILPLTKIGTLKNSPTSTGVAVEPPVSVPVTESPSSTPSANQTPETVTPSEPTPPVSQPQTPQQPVTPPPPRVVRIDAPPGSPDAPQQSGPLAPNQVPSGALNIVIQGNVFDPSSFVVKSGQKITLYFTSGDKHTHSINFEDESVQGIAVGVGPGETRSISFTAPKPGSYSFSCNVPGHASAGESGTMVVE